MFLFISVKIVVTIATERSVNKYVDPCHFILSFSELNFNYTFRKAFVNFKRVAPIFRLEFPHLVHFY